MSLTSNNENTLKVDQDTKYSKQDEPVIESQEPTEGSREMSRFSNIETAAQADQGAKSSKQDEPIDESQEPTERSREMSRFSNYENTAQVDQGAKSSKHDEPISGSQDPTERSREMSPIADNENMAKVNQDTNNLKGDKMVYESETPGELSQANALNFVDQYLSVSFVNSSPEVKIPKVYGMRSPLASCAKGSHDMAKKANLMTKIGISTFNFNDNQSDHGGEPFPQNPNGDHHKSLHNNSVVISMDLNTMPQALIETSGAAGYAKFVTREMRKAESLLKVILSPIDYVVDTYGALIPEGTPSEF